MSELERNECVLGSGRQGSPRVYHEDELIYVDGYGRVVGLRYSEALQLLRWLQRHQAFLVDRANNYYECHECGYLHHKSVVLCPALVQVDG
jgi:hypothetical protein